MLIFKIKTIECTALIRATLSKTIETMNLFEKLKLNKKQLNFGDNISLLLYQNLYVCMKADKNKKSEISIQYRNNEQFIDFKIS